MTRFEKDFRHLSRQIDSLSNGQARVSITNIFEPVTSSSKTSISSDDSDESSQTFFIEITPNDGPYAHASFVFRIEASSDNPYPDCAPIISCLTRIYHPNIDTTYQNTHNNVCVSTLNEWDSSMNHSFDDILQGLLFLFYSPNVDDPLTSNVTCEDKEFAKNVRISIEGGSIEDFDYDSFEMNYGYKRYLNEKQTDQESKIDNHLVDLLTRQTNFKKIFNADTLEFLMNESTASSTFHSVRHKNS